VIRKISLTVVLVVGVVWVVATVLLNLWTKAPAADHLTNALKPAFTNAGVAQEQADAKTVNAFVADLNTTTVPLLAKLTHQSNGQVVALVSKTFPTVGKLLSTNDNSGQPFADGQTYLAHAAGYITTVSTTFAAQQHNFDNARQIPTKGLPTQALTWLFVILGLVVLSIGGLFIWRPSIARPLGAALIAIGLVVVAVTLVIDVPGKTQSVDSITGAFRPVFATTGALSIDQGQDYLNAVSAADKTLETQLVPTLSSLLKLPSATVVSTLTKTSPVVSAALFSKDPANPNLSVLGGIVSRWDGIAAIVVAQRSNFANVDDIPGWGMSTTMVQFLLVGPALLLVLAGLGWVVPPLGAQQPVQTYRRRTTASVSS
jgi:hypothetical protein